MTEQKQDDDCVSKKPWGEVLSRSLKLFTFNAAREGGRSFGRIIFYIILALLVLMVVTFVVDSLTGWFSGWFDFWPFNRAPEVVDPPADAAWFGWLSSGEEQAVPDPVEDAEKWYCKWNPIC